LKEDANKAKTELMEDMKKFDANLDGVEAAKDDQEEPEDPRV